MITYLPYGRFPWLSLGRCKVFKLGSMEKCVSGDNRMWFYPFSIEVASWDSAELAATKAVVVLYSTHLCVFSIGAG